jgi:uncharacterized membrane protein
MFPVQITNFLMTNCDVLASLLTLITIGIVISVDHHAWVVVEVSN